MIPKIKGTNDFLELSLYNWIITQIKKELSLCHFHEIATPIIEPVELFKRSLGTHTDVVSKEMFVIQPHPNSSESICLRPEMTASTARAFVENNITTLPWRVFSYGPVFRYERPQKGRYRQFHQFNIEIVGAESVGYDVQLISTLDKLFERTLLLPTYTLHINFLGCFADRTTYKELLKTFLYKHQNMVCHTCQARTETNTLRIFDCKQESCQNLYRQAPILTHALCTNCSNEWQFLQTQLALLSVSFIHNPTLVRGLDYYNKTAFEFTSSQLGAQNTFCGGGRYDDLLPQLGAKQRQPAIGAAIGIERLALLLEPIRAQLPIQQPAALHAILPLATEQIPLALQIADHLVRQKISVELILEGSIKSMFNRANKMGAAYAIIIGSEEQTHGTVMVKNMITGLQEHVLQIRLIDYLV